MPTDVRRTAPDFDFLRPRNRDWPRLARNKAVPFVLSDDPADHGLTEAELACIEKAYEIRRREVRAMLEEPMPFRRKWHPFPLKRLNTAKEWLQAAVAVPVIALIVILRLPALPLQYLSHMRSVTHRRQCLRQELTQLERPPCLQALPGKTLLDLWGSYGFEEGEFQECASIELVSAWLDILYGPDTTKAMDIEVRLERINRRRANLRARSPNVTCVLWIPRMNQVVQDLSRELPPYDWLQRDPTPPGPARSSLAKGRLH